MGFSCTENHNLIAFVLWITIGLIVSSTSNQMSEGFLVRGHRDVYGLGGGYGGVYGGYAGSSTGCSCPYVSCDNKSDGLLAFGVGALLGLLLSMLRTMMMTAPTTAAANGRDHDSSQESLADFAHNVTWARESGRMHHPHQSTLLEMLHLPKNFEDDLVPVVADLFQIYTNSDKKPECTRRWICEATRQSLQIGGLRAQLGSLSSIAFGWFTKDLAAVLHNMIPGSKELDCKYLSPKCDASFVQD